MFYFALHMGVFGYVSRMYLSGESGFEVWSDWSLLVENGSSFWDVILYLFKYNIILFYIEKKNVMLLIYN